MHIGFIGLGIMGSRMATNLLNAGHTLTVYNRTPAKAEALVAKGATLAESPAAAVKNAELVVTVVAHPAAVDNIALGENGFLANMQNGAIWLNAATVQPAYARHIAEVAGQHNVRYLDAPVGGSKDAAANAQLTFIVGGEETVLEEARPAMETMSQRIIRVGPVGMGTALKLIFNNLLAVNMAAFAEALNLGQRLGIPRDTLLNVVVGSPVAAPFLQGKREMMANNDYADTQFPLQWMQKDLHMVAEAAFDVHAAMPLSNVAKEVFQMALAQGWAEADFAAVTALFDTTTS